MRRKTVRALAHVCRAVALAGCVLAGAVAWVWHARPEWVDSLEAWIRARDDGDVAPRVVRAKRIVEPAARRAVLLALHEELRDVRSGDRLAPAAIDCRRQLAWLAERAGDLDGAIAWWQQLLAFDAADMQATAELARGEDDSLQRWQRTFAADASPLEPPARIAELQARDSARATAALHALERLRTHAPRDAAVLAAYVRALATAGRHDDAFALLDRPAAATSGPVWRIATESADGEFGEAVSVIAGGTTEEPRLSCALAAGTARLLVVAPHAGWRTADWRLAVAPCTGDPVPELQRVEGVSRSEELGAAWTSSPGAGLAITFYLPAPLDRPATALVTARAAEPVSCSGLAALAPPLVEVLRERAAADGRPGPAGRAARSRRAAEGSATCAELAALAVWLRAGASEDTLDDVGACSSAAVVSLGVESRELGWYLPRAATLVELQFPASLVCHPWVALGTRRDGFPEHRIELAELRLRATRDVERTPFGFVVVGPAPMVQVLLPSPATFLGVGLGL